MSADTIEYYQGIKITQLPYMGDEKQLTADIDPSAHIWMDEEVNNGCYRFHVAPQE